MSAWPGKTVIGLTGNIGTGKSVVRRMLEHLGAYGIDADALAHRAMMKGAPGYKPVVDTFGRWILGVDGQVDRARLGKVVFADPEALSRLESILHPFVGQAIDVLVRRSTQPVIVIEAIKLFEAGLAARCDIVWVTYASKELQVLRLIKKRGMSEATARSRILAQPPQEEKMGKAQVLIKNDGSIGDTWKQVIAAWKKHMPGVIISTPELRKDHQTQYAVQRGHPGQAGEIAEFINQHAAGNHRMGKGDIITQFGDKAFLLLYSDKKLVGVAGWQVENLVSRLSEFILDLSINYDDGLRAIINEVERASKELQCEASLVFLPKEILHKHAAWRELGYEERHIDGLLVRAWEEAAIESMPPNTSMIFRQLRKDRVLRPV